MPLRVMFEEKSDPTESVDVLSHSEIDRVIVYMRMHMNEGVAAQKEQTQAKSPHWWDDRELVTGKFEKEEFVTRVIYRSADRYVGPIASNRPTRGFQVWLTKSTNSGPWPGTFEDHR